MLIWRVKTETGAAPLRGGARPFVTALKQGGISPQDKNYPDELGMSKVSLSQSDADKRVTDVFVDAKQAAEATRKAVAHSLTWTFLRY